MTTDLARPVFEPWRAPLAAWEVGCASTLSPSALQVLQQRRRIALFEAAHEGSRWVRRAFAGRDPRRVALHDLPVMRKRDAMCHFDDWVADPRLRLDALHIAPCEVWTGGENLGEATRAFVEHAFGCPLAHSYGASEFLALATSECPRRALHLNSGWALLEPVDSRGRPVAACGRPSPAPALRRRSPGNARLWLQSSGAAGAPANRTGGR